MFATTAAEDKNIHEMHAPAWPSLAGVLSCAEPSGKK
jgi:hypothetical protein